MFQFLGIFGVTNLKQHKIRKFLIAAQRTFHARFYLIPPSSEYCTQRCTKRRISWKHCKELLTHFSCFLLFVGNTYYTAQMVRVAVQTSLVPTERVSSHVSDISLYTLLGFNLDNIYLYLGQLEIVLFTPPISTIILQ